MLLVPEGREIKTSVWLLIAMLMGCASSYHEYLDPLIGKVATDWYYGILRNLAWIIVTLLPGYVLGFKSTLFKIGSVWVGWLMAGGLYDEVWGNPRHLDDYEKISQIVATVITLYLIIRGWSNNKEKDLKV